MAKPKKLMVINGKRQLVPIDYQTRTETDKAYNQKRNRENKEYVSFYKTTAWRHTREQVLLRDYSTCVRCGLEGNIVDHIIPSEDDWEDRLNIDNLETLCQRCHNLKTKREWIKKHKGRERAMQIHVVIGYPASGKSTYVARHMTSHDLVYDYDLLTSSLDGSMLNVLNTNDVEANSRTIHKHNIDVNDYVQMIYEMILRKIKSEKTFENVWLIMTKPDDRLTTLLTSYDVDWLMLGTSKEECINRLHKQHRDTTNSYSLMNEVDRLINDLDLKVKLIKQN